MNPITSHSNLHERPLLSFVQPNQSAVEATSASTPVSTLLSLRHIRYALADGRVLFNEIDLNLQAQRVGLIGNNGAGKSLLAKIIVGDVPPDLGRVVRLTNLAYTSQNLRISAGTTVAEMLGMQVLMQAFARVEAGEVNQADFDLLEGRWDTRARLQAIWASHGLPPTLTLTTLAAELSAGQRMKVALCAAFASHAGFLLLDEPSNHLDQDARQWLREQLRHWDGGALIISHDRELLEDVTQVIELSGGRFKHYGGNYGFYQQQHAAEVELAQTRLEQAKQEKKKTLREQRELHDEQLKRAATRKEKAKVANIDGISSGRQKDQSDLTSAKQRQQMQNLKGDLSANVTQAAQSLQEDATVLLTLPQSAVPTSKQIVSCVDVVLPFAGDMMQRQPISFTLQGPVRVGVMGPNGCGKTTLLKVIAGLLSPQSGQCELKVKAAWLDQSPEHVLPFNKTVLEQLEMNESLLPYAQQRTQLARLGLDADLVERPAGQLSGGQWFKAALACMLWSKEPAQLLLMDEPTNHLDLWALASLEQALRDFTGAMMIVSHDKVFLNALQLMHTLTYHAGEWILSEANSV